MIGVLAAQRPWWQALTVPDWAALVQTAAIVLTLAFIWRELRLHQRSLEDERLSVGYQVYQTLSHRYADLMWRAAEDPRLATVWSPFDPARQAELEMAQHLRHVQGPSPDNPLEEHGAYFVMDAEERLGYRFTRTALEAFEQAHKLSTLGLIDGETWAKWEHTFAPWRRTRYVAFVLADHRFRFRESFVDYLLTDEVGRPPVRADRPVMIGDQPARCWTGDE